MSRLLQDVVGELSKLPGVGRRTALRLAIHILRMERESVAEMTESIDRFRNEVKYCTQCNNLSDEEVCPICADDERDHTTICVVEQVADVLSVENTRQYKGLYHVLGAARALWGHGEGIACILGTGSNSCLCRDGEILKNVPPLGYVLGDEGSGAVLGRNLVNGIFKGHIPLKEEFLAAHGLNYEEIIRRVYREPYANRFLASFAPFIRTHIDRPEIRELVLRSFRDFASRNLSRYPAELPVSLLGGVAAHFEALLREALEAEGRRVETIVESPAEGLLKYHYGR